MNFVEIIFIYINDTIFINYFIHENKLNLYNYKIFNKNFWVIYLMLKLYNKL